MFAMPTALNLVTFTFTALFYAVCHSLMCDLAGHVWVALKCGLAPVVYLVEVFATAASINELDVSVSTHPTPAPAQIASLGSSDFHPRAARPPRVRSKFSYIRERDERERIARERLISSPVFAKVSVKPRCYPTPPSSPELTPTTTVNVPVPTLADLIPASPAPQPTPAPAPAPTPAPSPPVAPTRQVELAATVENVAESSEITPVASGTAPVPSEPTSNPTVLTPTPAPVEPTSPTLIEPIPPITAEAVVPPQAEPILHPVPIPVPEPAEPAVNAQPNPEPAPALLLTPAEPTPLPASISPSIQPEQVPTPVSPEIPSTPLQEPHPAPAESVPSIPPAPIEPAPAPAPSHTTPTAPILPTQPTTNNPVLDIPPTVNVPARAPNVAARPDSTVTHTPKGSDRETMDSLAQLFGQMSIQELVEHEMEDRTEKGMDTRPIADMVTGLLKELELGMWDCVEDMERWCPLGAKLPSLMDTLEDPDVDMDSPILDTTSPWISSSPMILDAHDILDTEIELPEPYSCVDTEMDAESAWMYAATPQASSLMDWTFSAPNPWLGPTPPAAPVPAWNSEGHAPDVDMEDSDASSEVEGEGEAMDEVVEDEPAEVLITEQPPVDVHPEVVPIEPTEEPEDTGPTTPLQGEEPIFDSSTPPTEVDPGAVEVAEDPQEAVDELAEELAEMWTPAPAEPIPEEDPSSDREETEEDEKDEEGEEGEEGEGDESEGGETGDEEDVEAELAALEEEHFATAAGDFLAGLETELLGAPA